MPKKPKIAGKKTTASNSVASSQQESSEKDFMEIVDDNGYDENLSAAKPLKKKTAKAGKKTIEEIYQKKTQLEHILLRPDTYIGSIESIRQQLWVWDVDTKAMVQREISYVPGFYKIFDEILVNAADNKVFFLERRTLKRYNCIIDP